MSDQHALTEARTPWQLPSEAKRLPALDGLRVLATAPVLLIHAGYISGGFLGVTLFFAISGFLIASLLLGERQHGPIAMRNFYVRRFARLYPALLLMLIMALIAAFVLEVNWVQIAVAVILAGTYTSNIFSSVTGVWLPLVNHAWTLAQEEQFYLVAPWLLQRMDLHRLRVWGFRLFAIAAALAMLRIIIALTLSEYYRFYYENPLLNLDGMIAGVALAFLVRSEIGAKLRRRLANAWVPLASIIAFVFGILFTTLSDWTMGLGQLVTVIISVLLLAHLSATSTSWFARVLSLRPFLWCGQRTYGIYLYHVPIFAVLAVTQLDGLSRLLAFAIATILTLIISAVSARWIEQPVSRYVRRKQGRTQEAVR